MANNWIEFTFNPAAVTSTSAAEERRKNIELIKSWAFSDLEWDLPGRRDITDNIKKQRKEEGSLTNNGQK